MRQTYNELLITPGAQYALFTDFILSLTQEAIEEKDGTIIVRSEEDLENIIFGIKVFAKSLEESTGEKIDLVLEQNVKENEDWIDAYKSSITPVSVGEFYIHPSWEKPKEGKMNIMIDPALAFGSGHHETTYGCLIALQKYLQKNATLLDVGCGSGILSIAAAKLGLQVDICDTDELAVQSACSNFKLNGEKFENSWVGSVQKREKTYDVVVANIIADVLIMLHQDLKRALNPKGLLILSGILDKYIDKVEEKYRELELIEKYKKDEWFTLVFKG
jgi:ribosomal protein L11 methyltransferase